MEKSNKKIFLRYFLVFILVFALAFILLSGTFSKDNNLTFLMMGIDSNSFKENSSVRSDTIMLINANKKSGEISIVSIPRDTKTSIEGRKNEEKVNHSFAYGGPELALSTVSNL